MPERVVFDTNIWISGLLWRGKPYRCLLLARGKVVEAVYCQPMAGELSQKLRTTFEFSENGVGSSGRVRAKRVGPEGSSHIQPVGF